MSVVKQGIVASVSANDSAIGRLTTGETVFGNKNMPLKPGMIVRYEETLKTQRYKKDGAGERIPDGNGGYELEPDPSPRTTRNVLATFESEDAFVNAMKSEKLLSLRVDMAVRKEQVTLLKEMELSAEEKELLAGAQW